MNIAIVGLGLIGGSLAKAISAKTEHTVFGIEQSEKVLDEALYCGAIDYDVGLDDLPQADLVLLALYPEACIRFAKAHAGQFRKGAVVSDVCGVKETVCDALVPLAKEHGFHFVGGHPMAGKEKAGFDYADAALLEGASYVLTPCGADPDAIELVRRLALSIGCGRVVLTEPQEHDRLIAFTSQLPHVLAAAYVSSPTCPSHVGYSAGSYLDVSRVALINEQLWPALFLQNAPALCAEITTLIGHLQEMRNAIFHGDRDYLTAALKKSRERKERYG